MKEHQLQKSIIEYIKLQYPKALYCASAGGLRTSITQAKRMKATGYIAGFPDLAIFEPLGYYYGLFLEIKTEKGRTSKKQLHWVESLNERNYKAVVVYGFDQAKKELDEYLNQKEFYV